MWEDFRANVLKLTTTAKNSNADVSSFSPLKFTLVNLQYQMSW